MHKFKPGAMPMYCKTCARTRGAKAHRRPPRRVWSVTWSSLHEKFVFTVNPTGAAFKREGVTIRGCGNPQGKDGYSRPVADEFVAYLNAR